MNGQRWIFYTFFFIKKKGSGLHSSVIRTKFTYYPPPPLAKILFISFLNILLLKTLYLPSVFFLNVMKIILLFVQNVSLKR